MNGTKSGSQGFTLIASLLLLLLMTGISIGLLMMVQTEGRAGGNDVENSLAYRGAEGAIENMTSSLAATFQNIQAPQASDITGLSSQAPTIPGITFPAVTGGYSLTPRTNPDGSLKYLLRADQQRLKSGIVRTDSADRPFSDRPASHGGPGTHVTHRRNRLDPGISVRRIFRQRSGFLRSPQLDFADEYTPTATCILEFQTRATLTFHDKITAYGNVVRNQLPNGMNPPAATTMTVRENMTASGGCDGSATACRAIAITEGSVTEKVKKSKRINKTAKS